MVNIEIGDIVCVINKDGHWSSHYPAFRDFGFKNPEEARNLTGDRSKKYRVTNKKTVIQSTPLTTGYGIMDNHGDEYLVTRGALILFSKRVLYPRKKLILNKNE